MKNKKKYLLINLFLILLVVVSSFSIDKSNLVYKELKNKTQKDSTEYPTSDLYLIKDINNQPFLIQITKCKKNEKLEIKKAFEISFYPSALKATHSNLFVEGLIFNILPTPFSIKYGVLADSIPMTKSDSLAEIKRFSGLLYKNGDRSKKVRSYGKFIRPRYLKIYSADWNKFEINSKTKIAEGNITSKNKLRQKEEFVFRKSKSTLKLIILENKTKENYVLKLAFEGEDKFKNNQHAYIQLIGYAGNFSIPLGTFVNDAINPNYLYLPIEKELVEKLLAGKASYSLKFQNPVAYQFSEIRLNQF